MGVQGKLRNSRGEEGGGGDAAQGGRDACYYAGNHKRKER